MAPTRALLLAVVILALFATVSVRANKPHVTLVTNDNTLKLDEDKDSGAAASAPSASGDNGAAAAAAAAKEKAVKAQGEKGLKAQKIALLKKQKQEEAREKHLAEKKRKAAAQLEKKKKATERKSKAERRKKAQERRRKSQRVRRAANCIAWGDPHWTTFDGRRFDWYTEGEYVLAKDPEHNEEVHNEIRKPRSGFPVAYNTGAAFRSGRNRIAIQYKNPRGTFDPRLYVDGRERGLHRGATYRAGNLRVKVMWQKGTAWAGRHLVTIYSVKTGTKVTVRSNIHHAHGEHMRYMDLVVTYTGYYKSGEKTTGLCGRYNRNPSDDIIDRNGRPGPTSRTVPTWLVRNKKHSLFHYHAIKKIVFQNTRLSLLRLANNNKALVASATSACQTVPVQQRRNCQVDFIAGGGGDVVKEAKKMEEEEEKVF